MAFVIMKFEETFRGETLDWNLREFPIQGESPQKILVESPVLLSDEEDGHVQDLSLRNKLNKSPAYQKPARKHNIRLLEVIVADESMQIMKEIGGQQGEDQNVKTYEMEFVKLLKKLRHTNSNLRQNILKEVEREKIVILNADPIEITDSDEENQTEERMVKSHKDSEQSPLVPQTSDNKVELVQPEEARTVVESGGQQIDTSGADQNGKSDEMEFVKLLRKLRHTNSNLWQIIDSDDENQTEEWIVKIHKDSEQSALVPQTSDNKVEAVHPVVGLSQLDPIKIHDCDEENQTEEPMAKNHKDSEQSVFVLQMSDNKVEPVQPEEAGTVVDMSQKDTGTIVESGKAKGLVISTSNNRAFDQIQETLANKMYTPHLDLFHLLIVKQLLYFQRLICSANAKNKSGSGKS